MRINPVNSREISFKRALISAEKMKSTEEANSYLFKNKKLVNVGIAVFIAALVTTVIAVIKKDLQKSETKNDDKNRPYWLLKQL